MKTLPHIITGAVVAALPDVALLWVAGGKWKPRDHPAVRVHAWLHTSPWGFVLAALLGWASHLVADYFSKHYVAPGVKARRPWRW